MSTSQTSDSQILQDELGKAKETLSRLRLINGLTSTCCTTSNKCQGCWRHAHDVTIGVCSDRDGKYSGACGSMNLKDEGAKKRDVFGSSRVDSRRSRAEPSRSRVDSSRSRVDYNQSRVDSSGSRLDSRGELQQLYRQIESLEDDVRGPILSYIKNMERQNLDMTDAIDTIRRQFFAHERVCPAMNISSGNLRNGSDAWMNNPENDQDLRQKLFISQNSEQECRSRAESLEKELVIYREKLERSEARVKELFRKISERQSNGSTTSSEMLLENQLRREQQLTETYFKEATSKDKELSFLTIEKYNLENEVNSMVTDLESSNRRRDEIVQEKNRFETNLEECRQAISCLEQQLNECRTENKRLKTKFRGVLDEERTRDEKISENQFLHEKQIKDLRKKCKKYEEYRNSQKYITQRLENDRSELLAKARSLSNEYKMKISECENLREENQRLSEEISGVQAEASLSKTDCNNSRVYVESLKNELQQAKSSIKILEHSLQESKVNESKTVGEVAVFSEKEATLKDRIATAERERLLLAQEIKETRKNEIALKNEITQMKESAEISHKEVKELNQHCSGLKTDLELAREKYFQIKKANDELVLNKSDVERTQGSTNEELARLKANYEDIAEKNSKLCADSNAYKRIVVEKEKQLRKLELELAQIHKAKDEELKEILKKDREIAFLKARVSSTEKSRGATPSPSITASGQYESGHAGKDIEIYLERIVELECECKVQKTQIDELQENQCQAKKHAQRSDSLKQELESQDEEIQKLKREVSRSKQIIEDLQDEKDKLGTIEDERGKLRQEVVRLQAKVEEVSELKQACEEKEEEMKALKRMSSEEVDLEGKVSRLKDRCREKDEEIEELHQKVIALQVKIKEFMQQNSQVEDQMRSLKDKYSSELSEKERITQALKSAETKCLSLQNDFESAKNQSVILEKDLSEAKRQVHTLESEKEGSGQKMAELLTENKAKEEELEQLRKQVQELKEAAKVVEEEILAANGDVPDGASTPLDNSLDGSRLSLGRSGRTSAAYDRLEALEEENIHLLNKQGEFEDELDAAEEHAQELKNVLKAKRENVNELHAECDELKERLKVAEKVKAEMVDENEQVQQTCLLSKQKIEDLKAASERYMDESDELEKALTAAEKKIGDLEKRLEEVSGKCASSEGQLQSVTERLARKEKELQVVETQVDEQRKLCDGYKASAERQEAFIEKLRAEKVTAEENVLAMKLEMAKKEGTYKAGKEKVTELQTRLYEMEDKLSGKTNEWKKVCRENERLKKEIKELEIKIMELQTSAKKRTSSEVDKSSPKLLSLNTSVKGNSKNVEGLDTKLNSAQNKISTLEVELANDLRKFSLSRTGSDVSRRGYSSKENQLSPGSHSVGRARSNSNVSNSSRTGSATGFSAEVGHEEKRSGSQASFTRDVEFIEKRSGSSTGSGGEIGYEASTASFTRENEFITRENEFTEKKSGSSASFTRGVEFIEKKSESSANFSGDIHFAEKRATSSTSFTKETDYEEKRQEKSEFVIPRVEIDDVDDLSEDSFFQKLDNGNQKDDMSGENFSSGVESALFQADPFLSGGMSASLTRSDDLSTQIDESLMVESREDLTNQVSFTVPDSSMMDSQALTQETEVTQNIVMTSASTVVTGTSTSSLHSAEQWNGEEELIYF